MTIGCPLEKLVFFSDHEPPGAPERSGSIVILSSSPALSVLLDQPSRTRALGLAPSRFQTVVEPLVKTVDTQLSDLLHGAAEAGSAEEHQRFLSEVRNAVGQLQKFVQSHPAIEHLDRNPFHPVAIGKTLNASLAAVSNAAR